MNDDITALLAAAAILEHRRTLQDQVVVACAGETTASAVADFSRAPSFAALCANLSFDRDASDTSADVTINIGLDGTPDLAPADLDRLQTVAKDGKEHPDRPASELRLTTAPDIEWLKTHSGDEHAPLTARCVHDVFDDQARITPNGAAVSFGGRTLSYSELKNRSCALSSAVQTAGAQSGDVVAFLAHRSPELIVGLLAILRAGCAYLALDPDDPPARHERLLADAQVKVLLLAPELAAPVSFQGTVVSLDEDPPDPEPLLVDVTPDHAAYVSYTSGSTGIPKGVAVPHRAVSRLVRAPNWVTVTPDDVVLELSPLPFDASTVEIWSALLNGARLAILPPGRMQLDRLASTVRDEGVTVLLLTTGLFHQMVAAELSSFSGVRHVLTGGDVASPQLVRALLDAYPHLVFTNGYGPTENTSFTTCWTVQTPVLGDKVPIGSVVSGTSLAILDPLLQPVPVGVCGEMYAGGEGVALGYLQQPAETAQRFVPDPFSRRPGARMYRTGDVARWLPDGTVDFVGRVDTQVKVQGHRVEPGELEAELRRHPDVAQAVVVVQQDASGENRLLAYVVAADEAVHDGLGRRVRDAVSQTLPPYLAPWAVLVLDELSLTRNGKVDRKSLPALERAPRALSNVYVDPGTPLESELAAIWGEMLGVEPVGVDDDFFELGGHSLLAADLLGRIRQQFGVEVAARTLYMRPTVGELAEDMASVNRP